MTLIELAQKLRPIIEKAVESLDDATAIEATSLYPLWAADQSYIAGHRVRYDGVLYKVLQDHISQELWTPDVVASLYAKVLIPDENVISAWEQPESTNPYMTGDKVSHNGSTWVCTIDNNVWEPGVYGWDIITDESAS